MNLKECIEEYLFDCKARGLSDETIKNYGFCVKSFLNFCMDKDIDSIEKLNQRVLKQYSVYLLQKKYEESYINTKLVILKGFIKYLYDESYIDEKYEIKSVKKKSKVIKTFSDEEVEKILKVCSQKSYIEMRDKTILFMLVDCGLRAGEIIKLRDRDILDSNVLFIQGKGKKERYVPFSAQLKKTMMKYERVRKAYFLDKKTTPDRYFISRSTINKIYYSRCC